MNVRIPTDACILIASEFWDVKRERIYKKCQRQETVQARVCITYMLKAQGKTDREIGQLFGKRRSSVGHYKKMIRTESFTQENLQRFIEWINTKHRIKLPSLQDWKDAFGEN